MEAILGLIILYGIGKLLFGGKKTRQTSRTRQGSDTIFDYPEGGYGLDDDPSTDELMFLDLMEDED